MKLFNDGRLCKLGLCAPAISFLKNGLPILAAVTTALFVSASGAVADDDYLPPKVDSTTPTGVSLSDGSFIYTNTDISIGPLTLERFHLGGQKDPARGFFGTHMSNNFDIYVAGNLTGPVGTPVRIPQRYKPVVHIGDSASGVFVQSIDDKSNIMQAELYEQSGTLTWVSGAYVYTSQDGTVYTFNKDVAAVGALYSQRVASIVYPTGRTLTFTYNSYGNLKLVSDNSGYAL